MESPILSDPTQPLTQASRVDQSELQDMGTSCRQIEKTQSSDRVAKSKNGWVRA
ncbi:hypothetical protein So717_37320 [Roseobacter cerasinus]|uniref:Uncharacterized protein n=1 Tax=Roseobacter cerasinus TaxID=2602289 RepID=A0A640VVD3_9RHOB|nr:hypothetical protein So717_37320 [Roseobacter cerasinus]